MADLGGRGPKAASLLTFPVLGLQDWCQLARGNASGHLASHLSLALLTGHVERCVPIAVLQLQAGPFLHQLPHHGRQVQVGGQVQRTLQTTTQSQQRVHNCVALENEPN